MPALACASTEGAGSAAYNLLCSGVDYILCSDWIALRYVLEVRLVSTPTSPPPLTMTTSRPLP